jgi:hypothetical protein
MNWKKARASSLLSLLLLAASCGDNGLSTAEFQQAAKERVRAALNLTPESTLFTNVFVGKPAKGDMVLCGTVQGQRADGSDIGPRRFIVATDPARWLKFEPIDDDALPSQPDKFLEWSTSCTDEAEVR